MNKYVEAMATVCCKRQPQPGQFGVAAFDKTAEACLAALIRTLREDDGAVEAIMTANSMVLRNAAKAQISALADYLAGDE